MRQLFSEPTPHPRRLTLLLIPGDETRRPRPGTRTRYLALGGAIPKQQEYASKHVVKADAVQPPLFCAAEQ
ncbi:hypothetical protein [Halopseudomonas sp.]|uniref:hypothetical protein n=1 Tax=Halopseudomonas sp. TaxID=2901191 RepID=UPI0031200095